MLKEVKDILPKINDAEKRIFEARQIGVSFCNIPVEEMQWYIDQIMLRGAAIGGCAVPNTEFFAEIIGEELAIFIKDYGYGELTYEEILLALRLNAQGGLKHPSGMDIEPVHFFGVCFNIDYFSKIMANYMSFRTQLDRKIQNKIDGYSL